MSMLRVWPGLLTAGARWGGKVRPALLARPSDARPPTLAAALPAAATPPLA